MRNGITFVFCVKGATGARGITGRKGSKGSQVCCSLILYISNCGSQRTSAYKLPVSHYHTELIIIHLALKAICRNRIDIALVEVKALVKSDLRKHWLIYCASVAQ